MSWTERFITFIKSFLCKDDTKEYVNLIYEKYSKEYITYLYKDNICIIYFIAVITPIFVTILSNIFCLIINIFNNISQSFYETLNLYYESLNLYSEGLNLYSEILNFFINPSYFIILLFYNLLFCRGVIKNHLIFF